MQSMRKYSKYINLMKDLFPLNLKKQLKLNNEKTAF